MKKLLFSVCMLPVLAFAQAVLPTAWDFSNPNVANPPTGWAYSLGTGNLTYQSGVGDNVSLRFDQTDEYLQINFADKPGPLSYYTRAQYGSNPGYTGTFSVQESVDGSTWNNVRQFTDGQLTTTLVRYQHNLNAASRFVRFFFTNKISGSNVQVDSVMIQAPPAPSQGISVFHNAAQLVNKGLFTFGNAASKSFTLQNFGTLANLQIDSVRISGTHAADFTVGAFDQSIAPNNGTGNLAVQFVAGGNGSRFATVKIYSNDAERNPFEINLYGIGGNLATEPATQSAGVSISNIRPFAMNVSFSRAAGGAERYIVLRKAGGPVNAIPVDGVTYKKGDYIDGSQVAYIGTDTALLKPTYILANTAYSFAAFAYNGPEGYENYKTDVLARETATTQAEQIGTYYANVNANAANFISALAARLRAPHDTVFYSNYAPTLVNNFLTRDTSGGKKVVNCVYTGIAYVYEDPFLWQASSNSTGILTREHTFAQSWMPTRNTLPNFPEVGGREILEYNDLHHLFPADQNNANGVRSNHPFGVVVNVSATSPTGFGKRGTDSRGITVYEPKDDQKGNLARALFYMLVRYDGERSNQWRLPANQDINVLLQWHQQDPPDPLEIARNEYIASIQHNRNPFIDYPQWANRINFGNMTYIPDPNAGIISVTAPAGNATIVRFKPATISWTSQNVDSVLVEIRTSPSGNFTSIGKYLASAGSVTRVFDEAATNAAMIRISKVGDPSTVAISGNFQIVAPAIQITAPADLSELKTDSTYLIKWTRQYTDSVAVMYQYEENASLNTTIIADNLYNTDSVSFAVPDKELSEVLIIVREKAPWKAPFNLAADTITVRFKKWTGLAENTALNHQVTVYPVPSNGLVHVAVPASVTITSIEAYDVTGKLVAAAAKENQVLLSKGLYVIRISTDKGIATKRVIVE